LNLLIVGCTHHECPLELRERLAFSAPQVPRALTEFRRRFPEAEAVLLSTCNRTELYTAAEHLADVPTHQDVADFLADFHGLDAGRLFDELFQRSGEDAVRHLFMVAASLDSMVVGEAQILSQVKQAYRLATEEKCAGQWTHAAFQAALRVAKRVSTETTIHQKRVSIPSIAVRDFASQIFERLDDKNVLVIGAGEMGEETLQYLIEADARNVTVVNRDPDKSRALAEQYQGAAKSWEQLDDLLVTADLVVSTTGADEPIVTLDRFRRIEAERYQRLLFIVDLAVPRDFDPDIGDCLGVYLYSLDDLATTCQANQRERAKQLPRALKIVDDETTRFMQQLFHRNTAPTIQQLKQSAESIKQVELERLFSKLDSLDERTREEITYAFHRLVNKMLHPPLESLREEEPGQPQQRLLDSLRKLFQLKDSGDP
jgi:glutamyl-tRNA reductase